MAVYKIYPTKDATLYSEFPNMNTGVDAILECSTYPNHSSRFLIKFSQEEILGIVENLINTEDYQVNLRSFIAHTSGIQSSRTLLINPIYGDWDMGTGYYKNSPETNNGVSWAYRKSYNVNPWLFESYPPNVTGSFDALNEGGGNWYDNLESEFHLNYGNSKDINSDVTDIVNSWVLEDIPNEGFIVRQDPNLEFKNDRNFISEVRYFSIDTNTIYPPHLEFRWEDYKSENLGDDPKIMDSTDYLVSLDNNKNTFNRDSIVKFKVNVTPKYPTRQYKTSSIYSEQYYLPLDTSYYAIKDLDTNLMVVDFDEKYTKISSDQNGSYFNIYMKGLEPERYYTIMLKVKVDGEVKIYEGGNLKFKVING